MGKSILYGALAGAYKAIVGRGYSLIIVAAQARLGINIKTAIATSPLLKFLPFATITYYTTGKTDPAITVALTIGSILSIIPASLILKRVNRKSTSEGIYTLIVVSSFLLLYIGYLLLPASWSPDEPLDRLVRGYSASRMVDRYRLVITGDYRRNDRMFRRVLRIVNSGRLRNSILITGYLPYDRYVDLLRGAAAVVAVTTREYTMLSSIWEAVACGKPFITVDTMSIRSTVGSSYPCMARVSRDDYKVLFDIIEECLDDGKVESYLEALKLKSSTSLEKLKSVLEQL